MLNMKSKISQKGSYSGTKRGSYSSISLYSQNGLLDSILNKNYLIIDRKPIYREIFEADFQKSYLGLFNNRYRLYIKIISEITQLFRTSQELSSRSGKFDHKAKLLGRKYSRTFPLVFCQITIRKCGLIHTFDGLV